jgi:uncharacterized membrane protein (DUF106 family)
MNITFIIIGAIVGAIVGIAVTFIIQIRREKSYQRTLKLLQELEDNLKVEKTLIEKVQEEATKK